MTITPRTNIKNDEASEPRTARMTTSLELKRNVSKAFSRKRRKLSMELCG
jgi:hypothetical protein